MRPPSPRRDGMANSWLRTRILEFASSVLIKRDGAVYAYGKMPNTNRDGWYLVGQRDELIRQYEHEANR